MLKVSRPRAFGEYETSLFHSCCDFQWSQIPKYAVVGHIVQCPPYQAVTGKIYRLKQHFFPPAIA